MGELRSDEPAEILREVSRHAKNTLGGDYLGVLRTRESCKRWRGRAGKTRWRIRWLSWPAGEGIYIVVAIFRTDAGRFAPKSPRCGEGTDCPLTKTWRLWGICGREAPIRFTEWGGFRIPSLARSAI